MADKSIRKEFVDGVFEVFSVMFNDLKDGDDGILLYLLNDERNVNVYGEKKKKVYLAPKRLVSKVNKTPQYPDTPVEELRDKVEFTIPLKSFDLAGIKVDKNGLDELKKSVIKFGESYFSVDRIVPKAFVENVFLMYSFICKEEREIKSLKVKIKEVFIEDSSIKFSESS